MTNNGDDPFGLALEREEDNVEPMIGLMTPGKIDAADLETVELAYRNAHAANHQVLFIENEDPDDPTSREVFENAAQWQAILEFPRPPTVREAEEWVRYHQATLEAATYWAVEDFRRKRAAIKQPARPVRPPVPPVKSGGPTA